MRKPPPAERLLSLAVGAPRAAALYGDLEELSATRSRLWFWAAYVRTLIAITWRTPLAFVIALESIRLFYGNVLPWRMDHFPRHLSDPGLFGEENFRVSIVLWNLSVAVARSLCFATPFLAARFGLRNRLTQLACALLFCALPIYCFTPWARDLSSVLVILATVVAFTSKQWRTPLTVLAGTILAAVSFQIVAVHSLVSIYGKNYFHIPASIQATGDYIAILLTLVVCLYLSRQMPAEHTPIA